MKQFFKSNDQSCYSYKISFLFILFFLFAGVCMAQNSGGEIKREKDSEVTLQRQKESSSIYLTDYSKARVGDYFYSDGSFSHQKGAKKCIGVVFSLKTTNEEKKHGWTHGQVWGVKKGWKYPGCGYWGPNNPYLSMRVKSINDGRNDKDGYKHTNSVNDPGDHMFNRVRAYTPQPPTGKTSGWYVPSLGQWIEYFEGLGQTKVNDSGEFDANKVYRNLKKFGLSYCWLWIANESADNKAWGVHIASDGGGYFYDTEKKGIDMGYECEMCFSF